MASELARLDRRDGHPLIVKAPDPFASKDCPELARLAVAISGGELDKSEAGFSPEAFGAEQFPAIRDSIVTRAVDAAPLSEAVAADKAAAAAEYGVAAGIGSVIPVKFTGTVGEGKSGIYNVDVPGLAGETRIRVQTGPAINGTDLRDATGHGTIDAQIHEDGTTTGRLLGTIDC